jgi:hypothetical protein
MPKSHPPYSTQEYLVARLLLDGLAPRRLVLTVSLNDFGDLIAYRRAEEIAAPPELAIDVPALAARIAHPRARTRPTKQLHRPKLCRLFELARRTARKASRPPSPPPVKPPAFRRAITEEALWAPGTRYYERVIGAAALSKVGCLIGILGLAAACSGQSSGTPFLLLLTGYVLVSRDNKDSCGNIIVLKHSFGYKTVYCHRSVICHRSQ